MDEKLVSPSRSVSDSSSGNPGFSSPAPSAVLNGVVAYVEVRTQNDNRSAAVKWVLERMGAKVADKFSDDVTHVIFKEGKKRTRDKALKLGVHLLSVLWVDSCKEKQQRVPEDEFFANTEHCSTPPPGVRWKKYKSMQPRDFSDEVERSAERCQKRQKRRDNCKQLLQGIQSPTTFHSPDHILVLETQPRTPVTNKFSFLDIQTPVIIPSTPPSMQARLNRLNGEKEARRKSEAVASPAYRVDLASLQKTLFRSQTTSEDEETDKSDTHSCRRPQLSGGVSKDSSPGGLCSMESSSPSCDLPKSSSQLTGGSEVISRTEADADNTSNSELVSSAVGKKGQQRPKGNPGPGLPHQDPPRIQGLQKRRTTRQSMPARLPQHFSSQLDRQDTQQSGDTRPDNTAVYSHSSTGHTAPVVPSASQEPQGASHKKDSSTGKQTGRKSEAEESGRHKLHDVCVTERSSKNKRGKSGDSCGDLASQDSISKTSGSEIHSSQSVNRRRKLLNPSQEFKVLSPSPTENCSISKPVVEGPTKERKGRKRKTCDVDAIFPPSSLLVPKRGCESFQTKENCGKRQSSTQPDSRSSSQISKESQISKGKKRTVADKRTSMQRSKGDNSVSSLRSTLGTSSDLGASMSMVFHNFAGSLGNFAPPRNSLAEFEVAKPQRQGKRATQGREGSNSQEVERDSQIMSLHKFRLTGMPSLVMTSLHREEQDFVISVVRKLGVFRVEDKVSKHTTHVVCGEPRRTLNILNAMARGCWLVSKQWVERSIEEGQWQGERDFEMVEDFPKCKESRLAREAEEPGTYQCRIFEAEGSVFVSHECTPPRSEIVKLLQLCGAKVTDSIQRADFYIGDKVHEDKNSIKPVWVLDCISQQELLPMDDYVMAINHRAKISSSPEF